jgi:hypothetical protein
MCSATVTPQEHLKPVSQLPMHHGSRDTNGLSRYALNVIITWAGGTPEKIVLLD